MKKIITICAGLLMTTSVFAQAPEKMSYQAVVRDGNNALVTSSSVGMQISILQGSVTGTTVYSETQTPTSNANGLVSLEIGDGIVVSGDFATIDWANGPYFIKTETDPTGGVNYTITGTSQLLSAPYALHAKNSDSWTKNADSTYTSDKVGISTTSPLSQMHLKQEGNNQTSLILESENNDASMWLYSGNKTWRFHNDFSSGNKLKLGLWQNLPFNGGNLLNQDILSIDTLGDFTIGTPNGPVQNKFEVITGDGKGVGIYATEGFLNKDTYLEMGEDNGSNGARFMLKGAGNRLDIQTMLSGNYTNVISIPYFGSTANNVGIGITSPVRKLHVNDVMRLEPRNSAPSGASAGDIYFNSTVNKLMVYDGTTWQGCW